MPTVVAMGCAGAGTEDVRSWPEEAQEVMCLLDDAFPPLLDRRRLRRHRYRVRGLIDLPSSVGDGEAWPATVYTRDVNRWYLGLLSPRPLARGWCGEVELAGPAGRALRLACVVRRCRPLTEGWYEALVHFLQEQPEFDLR